MKVGFIGLGGIGKPMAVNIVKSGLELTVADLREQPLQELRRHGARVARSPREVAEASDIVLASLPSNEASELVALGHDGILEGAAEGDIYVELSTISPTVVHSIAHKTTEKGVHLLDAPVSGGTARASKGRALHHDWRRCGDRGAGTTGARDIHGQAVSRRRYRRWRNDEAGEQLACRHQHGQHDGSAGARRQGRPER